MNKISVNIMGSDYNIVGKNPEEMKNVARYVDGEMNKIKNGKESKINLLTVAIVASLNIAVELFDCCHENEALHKEIDSLKENMGKPDEEVQSELEKKELELMEKDYRLDELELENKEKDKKIENLIKSTEELKLELEKHILEIEKHTKEIKDLKEKAEEANQRAEVAEKMSSNWQNKVYDYQLKCAKLESQLKDKEVKDKEDTL